MNKSECTKHVIYLYFALNVLSWNIAFIIIYNYIIYIVYINKLMSMEIVGVKSTDKRAVKCFDLIKTNKSESI